MIKNIDNNKVEQEIYKDIKNLLYKIRYSKSKSSFEQLTEEVNALYLLCDEFDLFDVEPPENYISRGITVEDNNIKRNFYINEMVKFNNYITNNLKHYTSFAKQANLFENYYYDYEKNILNKITNTEEIIEYTCEFMQQFDKRFIDAFNLLKDKNHLLFAKKSVFDTYEGVFIPNRYCDCPYMGFFLSENIDDSSSIVHEVAHMIHHNYAKNNYKTRNYPYYYQEVFSHFSQFAFYEFMKKKNIYVDDIDNAFKSCMFLLGSNLDSINYTLDNDKQYDYEELFYDFQYGYGIAIALKYLDIYQNDPEKAKYLINQFIQESYYSEPIEVLNKFGLNEEELVSGEIIKKYVK